MDKAKEEVKKANCFGIGKYQKAILGIPDNENDKPHSKGIKITKDGYAIATDTKLIVKIPLNDVNADELPTDTEKGEINPITDDIWLSVGALNKAMKHLPKNGALPILNNIFIREDEKKISLVANDLENQVEVKENKETCQENVKRYPSTDDIFKLQGVKYQATLGISLLKKLADILDKMANEREKAITFFFGDDKESPIHFSFSVGENTRRTAIGVMMPVKIDTSPEQNIEIYQKVKGKEVKK